MKGKGKSEEKKNHTHTKEQGRREVWQKRRCKEQKGEVEEKGVSGGVGHTKALHWSMKWMVENNKHTLKTFLLHPSSSSPVCLCCFGRVRTLNVQVVTYHFNVLKKIRDLGDVGDAGLPLSLRVSFCFTEVNLNNTFQIVKSRNNNNFLRQQCFLNSS